jgi:hypothetical protein
MVKTEKTKALAIAAVILVIGVIAIGYAAYIDSKPQTIAMDFEITEGENTIFIVGKGTSDNFTSDVFSRGLPGSWLRTMTINAMLTWNYPDIAGMTLTNDYNNGNINIKYAGAPTDSGKYIITGNLGNDIVVITITVVPSV